MEKQSKLDSVFINIAKEIGSLSYCTRSKVGAVLVKDGNIISFGYNGTPSGMDNSCEDKEFIDAEAAAHMDHEWIDFMWPHKDEDGFKHRLVTKSSVIHAESNAILKAAKSGHAVEGSTLYLTLSPCLDCCKLVLQSGVERVVYLQEYRNLQGVEFLKQFIKVEQYVTTDVLSESDGSI
jgi:dCMP deaminase